jgi:hypothetical protein
VNKILIAFVVLILASTAFGADVRDLLDALKGACPSCQIDGVAIAAPNDKSTWRVDYHDGFTPTGNQAATVQTAINNFDLTAMSGAVTVTRMQALVALSRAGILSSVQTWVASQDAETQLIWTNAPQFSRNSALLNRASAALGLTSQQVDDLFTVAQGINP